MKKPNLPRSFLIAALALATVGADANPVIYPAKGQSAQQQQKDDGECYTWAKGNSGYDPVAASTVAPVTTAAQPQGQRLRGAARGAVGGAAIGAIAGDTGKGAAIGAAAGTMAGGARARRQQATTQQVTTQAQTQSANSLASYQRAHGACMEGRGYSVK